MIKVRFNDTEAGEIEGGALPLDHGTYPFMPYRSFAHLELVTEVNKNGAGAAIELSDNRTRQAVLCKVLTADRITIE